MCLFHSSYGIPGIAPLMNVFILRTVRLSCELLGQGYVRERLLQRISFQIGHTRMFSMSASQTFARVIFLVAKKPALSGLQRYLFYTQITHSRSTMKILLHSDI